MDSWIFEAQDSKDLLMVPLKNSRLDTEFLTPLNRSESRAIGRYSVIVPRQKPNEHFFVEEILPFTPKYLMAGTKVSFAMYYDWKYGFKCKDLNQRLVRVSGADKRQHHFNTVAQTSSSEKKANTGHDQIFVPEFCEVHPIDASLWREVQLFPFVFERTASLIKNGKLLEGMKQEVDFGLDQERMEEQMSHLLKFNAPGKVPTCEQLLVPFTAASAGEGFNLESQSGEHYMILFV